MSSTETTRADWAHRYVSTLGAALVPIPPGSKAPKKPGWQKPGGQFQEPEQAAEFWRQHPEFNMGVVLGPSRWCSLDIDDLPAARIVFDQVLGMDLDALADQYPTVVGNPERFRVMLRVPEGEELTRHALAWPKEGGEGQFTVVEFRAGPVQDVLPPSIHPGTQKPYAWRTAPKNGVIPDLPPLLLSAWKNWDIFKRDALEACPWREDENPKPTPARAPSPGGGQGSGESVIDSFNRAHDIEQLLASHGYTKRGKRWLYAHSSTGLPGINIVDGCAFSHHAGDPLNTGHLVDPFELFCLLDHNGDAKQAVKAAADLLGMSNSRPLPASPPQGRGVQAPEAPPALPPEGGGEANQVGLRITLDDLLFQYRLVYGTDTAWDEKRKMQIKVSHLREAVGKETMREWQGHPGRRISEGIVFDPSDSHDRNLYINLYEGFKMQPDARGREGCEKILAHIWRLCGRREEDYFWLLKWLAYPLQHPGAKMATAVLVHGSEGTGKSLLFEGIIKRIYGEYGITIGQAQLEAQFTDWQSKRLFALAEEVVSRAEKSHYKGVLKHLVTGSDLQINPKNLPLRQEPNHINFVFLSNSTVPLELDVGDRRYFVMYCDDVPPPEHFQAVADEIDNGGIEAFYHYLLSNPLGDFGPHSKPPISNAKQELIDSSLTQARYFIREWQSGALDVPYQPCVVDDLWQLFVKWCEKTNEFKVKKRWFCGEVRRDLKWDQRDIRYPNEMDKHRSKNLFIPPEWEKRIGGEGWPNEVGALAREFRLKAIEHLKGETLRA